MDAPDPEVPVAQVIEATERWFLRRGLPHLIDDYRATEDVFTRTLPALVLVFILEVLGAAKLDWPWWQNALALAGGLAVMLGAWWLVNRARGRRGLQRPDTVGTLEVAVFVLVPPLLPVLFGTQYRAAFVTLVANALILGLIYLATSYGLLPMIRWALGRTVHQLGTVLGLFGRALPLLMLVSITLFLAAEPWQVAASIDGILFWATVTFFVLVGVMFLLVRLPGELAHLREQAAGETARTECGDAPVAEVAASLADDDVVAVPLSRRQQGNVLLVLLFSQAVQVVLVTVATGLFFFVFGLVAMRPEVVTTWLGPDIGIGELARWRWFGHDFVISRALIHIAGFIATVAGFYFTVYVITDSTYRDEFFTEIVGEVRQSLAVRNVYLALIRRSA